MFNVSDKLNAEHCQTKQMNDFKSPQTSLCRFQNFKAT